MNIGIIPLRKGSKRIPGKNKKEIAGKPLFRWVLDEAVKSQLDKIYVYTDDADIASLAVKEYMDNDRVIVKRRDDENATDEATTEAAMVEFCDKINWNFDNIMLLQATSPLTKAKHIDDALWVLENSEYDSIVSCVKQKRFIWDKTGYAKNYNIFNRPLSQNYEGYYVENGAIYATTRNMFRATHNRVSGDIGIIEMPEETYVEIDTKNDWLMVEALLKRADIKVVMTDCDGVLTDGGMYYGDKEYKKFNTKDGMGFQLLQEAGYDTGIISGEDHGSIEKRAEKLGVEYLILGSQDKLNDIMIPTDNLAYIGDDINDIELLKKASWSACPSDAHEDVKKVCDYVCQAKGGEGVFREVAEILRRR